MNVAAGGGREPPHRRRVGGGGGQARDAEPHQAAMDCAPTQGRRTTAVQDLRDIVEGQPQLGAQFGDEGFLLGGGTSTILDISTRGSTALIFSFTFDLNPKRLIL